MAPEWQKTRLGEIARFKAGSAFKPEHQGRVSGEIPFIKVSDLNLAGNEHAIHHSNNWVSRDLARKIKAAIHPVGATVFAKIGVALTYNRRRLLIRETAIDNNMMSAIPDESAINPRYLYFLLQSLDFNEIAHGSALPYLNAGDLQKIEITLPPIEEQRAIVEILGALDDRIDNLRQTNATLEAIAAALFKSWFVDFDGVPPEDMQESELGLIPKGWRVGALGDVAEHPRRGVQPEAIEAGTPYIALEHMPRRSTALNDWGVADDLESNKYEFKRGEILFGKLRPYFHKVGVAPLDGVCSTDIVVIATKSPAWFAFVLALVSSDEFVEYTNAGSTGTKMPRTSWTEMARYRVALPPDSLASEFNAQVEPMATKVIANIHESRTLAALRDALLPRLISGQLRVTQ